MQTPLPLEGIRITDFTWIGAGPLCTKLLAMHGAQVVKVESAVRMDIMRTAQPIAPGKTGVNVSGEWNHFNGDKLGITLNMGHPKGRELVHGLVSVSDVVANSFTPGVMERWGLDYESLARVKPDIITLSMPVMGKDGPKKNFSGFGNAMAAMSGMYSLLGEPGDRPSGYSIAYTDFSCNPYHAATAVMAALLYRDMTGKGQEIDLAQYESTINFLGPAVLEYTANHRVPQPRGNRLPYAAPHGAYMCRGEDRWCTVAVFTDQQWKGFARVVTQPWTREERFSTITGRLRHVEELDRLVEAWTRDRDAFEVMDALQKAGVPAGVVQTTEDLFTRDPQLKARGFFTLLDHAEAGLTAYQGPAFELSETPGRPVHPAPLLGEYNEYVIKEILGLEEEEFANLLVEGVVE